MITITDNLKITLYDCNKISLLHLKMLNLSVMEPQQLM